MALFRIRTIATGVGGAPWYSNFHFTAIDGQAASQRTSDVLGFWQALATSISEDVTITLDGILSEIDEETGQVVNQAGYTPLDVECTGTADILPPATQLRVRWLTGVFAGGRQITGATNIYGLTEAVSTNGAPSAPFRIIAADAAALLIDPEGLFSVYSPTNGLSAGVTSAVVPNEFAVLTSRRD